MKVGIHLPQLGRAASLDLIVDVAKRAESLGFDDVWAADHIAVPLDLEGMPSFFPEPVPLLSAAAAHTSSIGLGTSVIIPAYRNPMHFAKQWATLDWLAPGRTILGVGAGWLQDEFDACGVPMVDRAGRLDDYIGGWRAAWSGQTEYRSGHWSFERVRVKPQPQTTVPVWIGGSSDGALRRAARCEGWQGTWAPPAIFAERLARLREHIAAEGRDETEVTFSIHCEVRVGSPLDGGGRWSEVGDGYGDRDVLVGDPARITEVISEYASHGLEHVLLVPLAPSRSDWLEHVEVLSDVRKELSDG